MTFTHFAVPGERKLDGQSTSPLLRSLTGHQSPAVNIGESDSAYRITVDLPGLSKENINIDVVKLNFTMLYINFDAQSTSEIQTSLGF